MLKEQLPKDPVMLLSVINTKLRDHYASLDLLCEDLELSKGEIVQALAQIDYTYDTEGNQFV
ncbi:MAG: DUF4250 domain-containing protein [Ruminococcus sp.]|nr:DUF4250 domain-containing protein [Ruminococcus sp.]